MGWAATLHMAVPVYNEVQALPGSIEVPSRYLAERFPLEWTITVVDNESTDDTLRRCGTVRVVEPSSISRELAIDQISVANQ